MIDVNAVVQKALAGERQRVDAVRAEQRSLLSKLMGQRDEITTTILNLTAQIADSEADLSAIDTAAASTANTKP